MPAKPIGDDLGFHDRNAFLRTIYTEAIFMSLPALTAEPFEVEQAAFGKALKADITGVQTIQAGLNIVGDGAEELFRHQKSPPAPPPPMSPPPPLEATLTPDSVSELTPSLESEMVIDSGALDRGRS